MTNDGRHAARVARPADLTGPFGRTVADASGRAVVFDARSYIVRVRFEAHHGLVRRRADCSRPRTFAVDIDAEAIRTIGAVRATGRAKIRSTPRKK